MQCPRSAIVTVRYVSQAASHQRLLSGNPISILILKRQCLLSGRLLHLLKFGFVPKAELQHTLRFD